MRNIIKDITEQKIYGVIRAQEIEKAIEIANAYIEGGIKTIEMNTPYEATKEVISAHKDITIAQGGVITSIQAHKAIECGAKLLVSPILQMNLVKLSSGYKIPLILTATTPNEAYTAWKARIPLIKIYPIKDLGGITYIEDMLKPMQFLNVMPTGSVEIKDIKNFLSHGASAVALGRTLYKDKKYEEIVEAVKLAIQEAK